MQKPDIKKKRVLDHGEVSLVDRMQNDAALKVVNSARISYSSESQEYGDRDRKLVRYLIDNGHSSPFRHTYYTFSIKAPIFVFRQWMKYQVGCSWREYHIDDVPVVAEAFDMMFDTDKGCSWNEVSARYSAMKPEFYTPLEPRCNDKSDKQSSSTASDVDAYKALARMPQAYEAAYSTYKALIESGIAREMARMVLPQSIYSQAYWTASLQAVIHFLKERLNSHAQFEIREYAKAILKLIEEDITNLGIEIK